MKNKLRHLIIHDDDAPALSSHIPNKGEQMVRYYGYYSNVSRGETEKGRPGWIGVLCLGVRGIIQSVPQELGKAHPEDIRGRSTHLPKIPRADVRHFLHRGPRRFKNDPKRLLFDGLTRHSPFE